MSEVKSKRGPARAEKPSFLQKVLSFFKNLPANIARPFKNTWRELRKVTWPTRQNLINSTLLVLAFMVFMGVVIGLLDMGSTEVVKLLSGWAG
ncbi:MAG: preprotein translocase subunit SecE [Clostridiales bacterium]|nr:preprotein translocase subunit SecE [Clostridiales bacterium]